MRSILASTLAALILLAASPSLRSQELFTISTKQADLNPLETYNGKALVLALEKTRAEYGDYRLRAAPIVMNTARAIEEARRGSFPNFILLTTFQNGLVESGLDYARFPVDLGVTGYRIAFVSPQAKGPVSGVRSLDDLRKFSIGQGIGWADVEILRYNGFRVEEVATIESLARMVALGRVDLVPRGINELETELRLNGGIAGLDYDRSFALVYPLPRFYFSQAGNKAALQRITKGLLAAYADGSLQRLWKESYGRDLQFAKLGSRRIFRLETPNIDKIDFDYQRYYVDPEKLP